MDMETPLIGHSPSLLSSSITTTLCYSSLASHRLAQSLTLMDDFASHERVLAAAEVTPLLLRYTLFDMIAHLHYPMTGHVTFMQCLLQGCLALWEERAHIRSDDSPH